MKLLGLILLLFNLTPLHQAGYQGQGMKIAVIDGGFFRANDPTVFPQDQILGAYNLLEGDSLAVDTFDLFSDPANVHGTMVLSTMLYQDTTEGGFVGTAPKASFYLIKSEDIYAEYYEEVERLARAFRLADSLDVDIVTVSLGYSLFNDVDGQPNPLNFTYADMDGRTSPTSRAATELVRKGRLVVVAAGNDGESGYEGVVYKNVIGTYLHGPLLPKNPLLADWLITRALERRYGTPVTLPPLDDTAEREANAAICARLLDAHT